MKKYILPIWVIVLGCSSPNLFSQTQPVGWASLSGGTTGGFGGTTIIVDNRLDFISAVSGDDPTLVFIQDTIELVLYERVDVGSNKTIFGLTENAMLRYGGLELKGDNIIVQNLVIGDFYDGDWSGTTNSTDCITVFGQNIWIDHCWLWAGADGLLDIRSGNGSIADFVTVSYCRFSDHNKVTLVGSSDNSTQDRDHLRVTFHHCWYDGTVDKGLHQRNPRVRFGDVHVFNNYYEELGSYGIAARFESDVVVENTYFRFCPSPHQILDLGLGLEDPDLVAINNVYELCYDDMATNGVAFTPADFYSYTPDPVRDIPAIVMNEAGPYNPANNTPPIAVNDTIDYSNLSGGLNLFVTDNDLDADSDDLRLAQIVNQPAGIGFIKENKIIYVPPSNATGIDSVAYSVVDTEGGVDTGYVLIFMDGLSSSVEEIGNSDLVKVFPNPADEVTVIELFFENKKDFEIQIINTEGRSVNHVNKMLQDDGGKMILNTQTLPTGNYFITIKNDNKIYTKKIVVLH